MKIYTKAGDEGQTSLLHQVKVSKDHPRLEVYGGLDELNSLLGLAVSFARNDKIETQLALVVDKLEKIQSDLFRLGTELATPAGKAVPVALVGQDEITELEVHIDAMEARLHALTNFILPGGSQVASGLHMARSHCRKIERRTVHLSKEESVRSEVIIYLNRLSDFLFVCARFVNWELGIPDKLWKSKS